MTASFSTACSDGGNGGSSTIEAGVTAIDGTPYTDVALSGEATTDNGTGALPDSFTWSWTVDGVDAGISTPDVPSSATSKFEVWEVSVIASIGTKSLGPSTASITIVNKPPEVVLGALTDTCSATMTPLMIATTPIDADNDPVSYVFVWERSPLGSPFSVIPGVTTNSLSCTLLSDGDRVRVFVTPNDGEDVGSRVTSNIVTIVSGGAPLVARDESPNAARVAIRSDPESLRIERRAYGVPSFRRGAPRASSAEEVAGRDRSADRIRTLPARDRTIGITEFNVCHLADDGSIGCDGSEDFGLTHPPEGHFDQLALELDFGCALRSEDGGIECWGDPLEPVDQLSPPEGPFDRVELSHQTACALRPTGEIACWGDDSLGQASAPDGEFVDFQLSKTYGCAIESTGDVICWGLLD